jgi:hypothetical protein
MNNHTLVLLEGMQHSSLYLSLGITVTFSTSIHVSIYET